MNDGKNYLYHLVPDNIFIRLIRYGESILISLSNK